MQVSGARRSASGAQPSSRPGASPFRRPELAGRTAIATGSTSGICLGIAEAFAGDGMNVMLNGFGPEAEIEATRSRPQAEFGVRAGYCGADMAAPGEIAAMIEETGRRFGAVDVVVNNAGIQHVEAIETFPVE